ncbi:MAG: DUF6070 family protein [Candidatus Faecousia sp.]|nr:DUF6070 family protein [Candidatus Faecousia sp.]
MKWIKLTALLLLLLGMIGCRQNQRTEENMEHRVEKRCLEILDMYRNLYDSAQKQEPENRWEELILAQSCIDAIEERLLSAGLPVLDSDEVVPAYLSAGDDFASFLEAVRQGKEESQELISIRQSGNLGYRLFTCEDGQLLVYSMVASVTADAEPVYEVHSVLDWELTERGNFYYSIYPQWDKHYVAYTLIRLKAPDKALSELTRKYISAGGYVGSNLFLTDWTEEDLAGLCFNDMWEYLYRYEHGEQFSPDGYDYCAEGHYFEIPAEEFEEIILPYFDIDREELRFFAGYNPQEHFYPWRQIQSNELVSILRYYTMEPEVISSRTNTDGTITMTVQVISTDLKTDCLFSHELTVRPMEQGGFQFVRNRILSQGERGLPFCQPRLTWPGTC